MVVKSITIILLLVMAVHRDTHVSDWKETCSCKRFGLADISKQSMRMDGLKTCEIWTRNKEPETWRLNLVSIWDHVSKHENSVPKNPQIQDKKNGANCTTSIVHFTIVEIITDNKLQKVCNGFIYILMLTFWTLLKCNLAMVHFKLQLEAKFEEGRK